MDLKVFKEWVPDWLIKIIIVSVLFISLLSFALYYSNLKSTIAYYGFDKAAIQYSVVLMYATVVTFLALDARLIKFFTVRTYIILGLTVNLISYIICFYTKNQMIFLICRFFQGMACALLCSIVLNLYFSSFKNAKSRVHGYSLFYGGLQVSIPLCAIYCTTILHYLKFNYLFYGLSVLTGVLFVMVMVFMNAKGRFNRRIPLFQTDWQGVVLYTLFCVLFGYICVYGPTLKWFANKMFVYVSILCLLVLLGFVKHEKARRRPLLRLDLLKYRGFLAGMLLLTAFYIFKGTIIFVYNFAEIVLQVESVNMIPLWCVNIAGVIVGTYITARLIIEKKPLSRIIIIGFSLLGIFHLIVYLAFLNSSSLMSFYFPVFIYGLGTSTLFVPIVVFTVSSVPAKMAPHVSPLGIFARFAGFCISISLNNSVQLFFENETLEGVRKYIANNNYMLIDMIQRSLYYIDSSIQKENLKGWFSMVSLDELIQEDVLIKSSMNYFGFIFVSIIGFIFLLAVMPVTRQIAIRIRKYFIPY
ncbi:MAG: MFS transporter [Bacteroidales bacterium]